MLRRAIIALAFATVLSAQKTWIVDPGGTGNFVDLHAAITAASSGDTLLLRGGGHYVGTYTFAKHLTFVGEPPQRPLIDQLNLQQAPGTSLAMVGVDVTLMFTAVPTTLEDVELVRCDIAATWASLFRCTVGQANATNVGPSLYVNGGDVVVSGCTLYGSAPSSWNTLVCHVYPGQPAVQVYTGAVAIADSVLTGAQPGWVYCPTGPVLAGPSAALTASGFGGRVRLTRSSLTAGAGGSVSAHANWQATLEYDPSTSFTPAYAGGQQVFLPATGGQGAGPGGVMQCRAETGPGQAAALVASLGLHPPVAMPRIAGEAWIDPAAFVVLVIGFADPVGHLAATIPLPPGAPRGLPITVQAVAAPTPAGGLTAAVPLVLHVR